MSEDACDVRGIVAFDNHMYQVKFYGRRFGSTFTTKGAKKFGSLEKNIHVHNPSYDQIVYIK